MENNSTQTPNPAQLPDSAARISLNHISLKLSRTERWCMWLVSFGLMAILAIASWLKPDPSGLGTHQQLGLPGCTLFTVTGVRCPGCGMTTSWAHTMNGDLVAALQTNCAGTLLCLLSVAMIPCMLTLAYRGNCSPHFWFSRTAIALVIAIVFIAGVEWVFRLAFR